MVPKACSRSPSQMKEFPSVCQWPVLSAAFRKVEETSDALTASVEIPESWLCSVDLPGFLCLLFSLLSFRLPGYIADSRGAP